MLLVDLEQSGVRGYELRGRVRGPAWILSGSCTSDREVLLKIAGVGVVWGWCKGLPVRILSGFCTSDRELLLKIAEDGCAAHRLRQVLLKIAIRGVCGAPSPVETPQDRASAMRRTAVPVEQRGTRTMSQTVP